MTNLATLIGVKNLESLVNDKQNTSVVIEANDGSFENAANNSDVDYSKVVGIGSFHSCHRLANYLNLQKLATS